MLRQPIWTRTLVEEMRKMYETGVPLLVIAETLGRSVSAIRTRAQMNQFRRPRRYSGSVVDALQAQAVNLGLSEAFLPGNPSALLILNRLAETGVSSKLALDDACSIGSSSRNKALQRLRSAGLVFVDDLCSPGEVILTQRAYRSRPVPLLTTFNGHGTEILPPLADLRKEIETWLLAICRNGDSIDTYRDFLLRQIKHAQLGDIATSDCYSLFYRPQQKQSIVGM